MKTVLFIIPLFLFLKMTGQHTNPELIEIKNQLIPHAPATASL